MKEIEELGYTVDEVKKIPKWSDNFQNFCYLVMKKYGKDKKTIKKIAECLNVEGYEIEIYALKYKDETQIKKALEKKSYDNMDYVRAELLVKDLLNTHTEEEIIEVLSRDEYKNHEINPYLINKVCIEHFGKKSEEAIKRIRKRLYIYKQHLEELKKGSYDAKDSYRTEKHQKKALEMFALIMNDNEIISQTQFKKKYHLNSTKYYVYCDFWKEAKYGNQTMFELIQKRIEENEKEYLRKTILKDIEKILLLVESPIEIGDEYRNLDILDCLTYFEGHYNECIRALRLFYESTKEDDIEKQELSRKAGRIKQLLLDAKSKMPNYIVDSDSEINTTDEETITTILNRKFAFPKKDGVYLTYEDKLNILKELKENHIPITLMVFVRAIDRYNNGHLELITKETIDSYLEKNNKRHL